MSLMQFCPNCWTENPFEARTCERCGAELSETEMISSDQQLMQALHHPVPETREMAAIILGLRHDQQAVSVLMVRLQEEKTLKYFAQSASHSDNWETAALLYHSYSA